MSGIWSKISKQAKRQEKASRKAEEDQSIKNNCEKSTLQTPKAKTTAQIERPRKADKRNI